MTGGNNTASGQSALANNTTGRGNTASGAEALRQNSTGISNTASGAGALASNTTGAGNMASGTVALTSNTTGGDNTAVGLGALYNSGTGSGNVAVGSNAGFASTGSNNVYLGAFVSGPGGESNTIYLGVRALCRRRRSSPGFGASRRASRTRSRWSSTPTASSAPCPRPSVSRKTSTTWPTSAAGCCKLRPVTFRYTQAYSDGAKPIQYGLIAEEVADVFPELAVRGADGQVETVHYETLNVLLLNEFQKQGTRRAIDGSRTGSAHRRARTDSARGHRDSPRPVARAFDAGLLANPQKGRPTISTVAGHRERRDMTNVRRLGCIAAYAFDDRCACRSGAGG